MVVCSFFMAIFLWLSKSQKTLAIHDNGYTSAGDKSSNTAPQML